MDKLENIVVPTDFSPPSKHALRSALFLARPFAARIHLLHVVPEYEIDSAFHVHLPGRHEIEAKVTHWIDKAFADYLRGEAVEGVSLLHSVRYGTPAKEIDGYASAVGADLILIASHGRSGFERAVFGSVAEKVLRGSPLPVLIVRARPGTQPER